MKMHYDNDSEELDVFIRLLEAECTPEAATVELSIGLATLIIRFMLEFIPSEDQHPAFEEIIIEELRERLDTGF